MTCESCLHYEACKLYGNTWYTNNVGKLEPHPEADQLCKAYESKERFVELPCKIGDVVYSWRYSWKKEDGIVPYQITNLTITQNKKGEWKKKYRAMWLVDGKTRDWSLDFGFDEIGKTVFLTREEAEEAVKEDNYGK